LLTAINEPNGKYVETEELAAFAVATIKQLKARHEYYQSKGDTERLKISSEAVRMLDLAVES